MHQTEKPNLTFKFPSLKSFKDKKKKKSKDLEIHRPALIKNSMNKKHILYLTQQTGD